MTLQKKRCIATIAETQDRTGDLEIFSLTLSQLSYRGFRNKCPLQKMMRAGTHSWRVDGCLGAERGRHYISEVAQWLACWAHNPKVPGSKPGFAMHALSSPTAVTPWEACAVKVVRLILTRRIGKINADRVMNL